MMWRVARIYIHELSSYYNQILQHLACEASSSSIIFPTVANRKKLENYLSSLSLLLSEIFWRVLQQTAFDNNNIAGNLSFSKFVALWGLNPKLMPISAPNYCTRILLLRFGRTGKVLFALGHVRRTTCVT